MDIKTEKWEDVYFSNKAKKNRNPYIPATINKANGKEYFNASTNITSSTYNFTIRFCKEIEEVIFKTAIYRIVYQERIFNIITGDRYKEGANNLTLVGKYNGNKY